MKADDEIISINGQSLKDMPQDKAIRMLKSATGEVDFVVARLKNKIGTSATLPSKATKVVDMYMLY